MADKKSSSFIIVAVLGLIGVGLLYYYGPKAVQVTEAQEAAEAVVEEPTETVEIDVQAAIKDRILGDPSAPLKISEHSSFTCGHCGTFHKTTFKPFKEAYIDTGKAYLVFSDFPLNGPALHASMIARCLPEDKYFDFVQMLFERQEEWAYEASYLKFLKARAAENGLNAAGVTACIQNEELQKGILARMQASQTQWGIQSTPSFVLNNKTTITGGRSFEEFSKMINAALAENKQNDEAG